MLLLLLYKLLIFIFIYDVCQSSSSTSTITTTTTTLYNIALLEDGEIASHFIPALPDDTKAVQEATTPTQEQSGIITPTISNPPPEPPPPKEQKQYPEVPPPPFVAGRPTLFPPSPPWPPPFEMNVGEGLPREHRPHSQSSYHGHYDDTDNNNNKKKKKNKKNKKNMNSKPKPKPKAKAKATPKPKLAPPKKSPSIIKKKIEDPSAIRRTPIPIIPCGCDNPCEGECCSCETSSCPSTCPPKEPCACQHPFPLNDCEVPKHTSVMTIQEVSHLYGTCMNTASRGKILKALGQMVLDAKDQLCDNCGFLKPKASKHHQCSCACPQSSPFPSATDHYDIGAPMDCCLKQCQEFNSNGMVGLDNNIYKAPSSVTGKPSARKKKQFILHLHVPGSWELGSRRPDPYPTYPNINPSSKELPTLQKLALKTVEQMKLRNLIQASKNKKTSKKTIQKARTRLNWIHAAEEAADVKQKLQQRTQKIHNEISQMKQQLQQLQKK